MDRRYLGLLNLMINFFKKISLLAVLVLATGANAATVVGLYFHADCITENDKLDCSGNSNNWAGSQSPTYTSEVAEGSFSATGLNGCCTDATGGTLHTDISNVNHSW